MALNNSASKYMKWKWTELKGKDNLTIIVEDFNTFIPVINRKIDKNNQ